MTAYEPGDVILVPYPFGERTGGRKRPALVVSDTEFNQATGELIIAQITGRLTGSGRPGDYVIEEWKEAKLLSPGLVRARLATLKTSLVLRRLGRLTKADFRNVQTVLASVLGR